MKLQKKDFVKLDYTGTVKETGKVFDTTKESVAKKEEFYDSRQKYAPITIIIGENQILKGIDDSLLEHEEGDEYETSVKPEDGFGPRRKQLIKLIPRKYFEEHNITPVAGLAISVDNMQGLIRTVSGGRIIVDFNNPLAGKELCYKIKILNKISKISEKAKSIVTYFTRISEPRIELKQGELTISTKIELPEFLKNKITQIIQTNLNEIKKVKYKITKQHVENTQLKKEKKSKND